MLIKLTKVFHICYFILMCLIMVEVVWKMIGGVYYWGLLLLTILYLGYLASGGRLVRRRQIHINKNKLWLGARFISVVVMFVTAYNLTVELTWDWGYLLKQAAFYAENDFATQPSVYFAQYSNNSFWLLCLIALYKGIHFFYSRLDLDSFYYVSIAVSCLMMQISISYIHKAAKLLWGEEKAFKVGLFALLCAPFYVYSGFLYTDSPGMMFGIMLLYYYIKLKRESSMIKRVLYACIVGITASLCYMTKIMVFIIFIALLVDMIFSLKDIRCWGILMLVIIVSTATAYKSIDRIVQAHITITDEMQDRYEFPLTHWVMMGLGNFGGYSPDDVKYTYSFPSYKEKKEANIEEIKKRVKEHGFAGMAKHVFVDKIQRMWCESCMAGCDYISRSPKKPNSIFQKILAKKGEWNPIFLQYSWAYYFILILGLFLSGQQAMKGNNSQNFFVGRVAIFGIILFFFLWECNSRYLLVFLPVLILTAADGFIAMRKKYGHDLYCI